MKDTGCDVFGLSVVRRRVHAVSWSERAPLTRSLPLPPPPPQPSNPFLSHHPNPFFVLFCYFGVRGVSSFFSFFFLSLFYSPQHALYMSPEHSREGRRNVQTVYTVWIRRRREHLYNHRHISDSLLQYTVRRVLEIIYIQRDKETDR